MINRPTQILWPLWCLYRSKWRHRTSTKSL